MAGGEGLFGASGPVDVTVAVLIQIVQVVDRRGARAVDDELLGWFSVRPCDREGLAGVWPVIEEHPNLNASHRPTRLVGVFEVGRGGSAEGSAHSRVYCEHHGQ